jgi:hypothetical protein
MRKLLFIFKLIFIIINALKLESTAENYVLIHDHINNGNPLNKVKDNSLAKLCETLKIKPTPEQLQEIKHMLVNEFIEFIQLEEEPIK